MRLRLTLSLILFPLLAGCDNARLQPVCTEEFGMIFTPHDTTVLVGAQFQATIKLVGCGGRETFSDTFTWASSDTTVATVTPTPTFLFDGIGRATVTARSPGVAHIIPTGETYKNLPGPTVTVLAP